MKLWIDAQLSPSLAKWISQQFKIEAVAIRDIQRGLASITMQNFADAPLGL
jgi:predicted nuclease of predicted toxin-antitoxin system